LAVFALQAAIIRGIGTMHMRSETLPDTHWFVIQKSSDLGFIAPAQC
jgi:hypothetical protein